MVLNTRELFDGIAILTDQRNMRVTVKQSAKGAMICGASCFVGKRFYLIVLISSCRFLCFMSPNAPKQIYKKM